MFPAKTAVDKVIAAKNTIGLFHNVPLGWFMN